MGMGHNRPIVSDIRAMKARRKKYLAEGGSDYFPDDNNRLLVSHEGFSDT
jgi:hypothetical protein